MKNIFIALCILVTAVLMSCKKQYNEVTVPYNGNGYGNYSYTTRTDYYNTKGILSETRINTGSMYVSDPSNPYSIRVTPLYGWAYSIELSDWNNSTHTFKIADQDVYVNDRRVRVSPTQTGKINADGSLDYGYESFDYSTSMKTINVARAVLK